MSMNRAWASWVSTWRERSGITRRELASKAEIDPSYVTLIERDGYVPRGDKARTIIQILCDDLIERDMMLLQMGYAPMHVTLRDLRRALKAIHEERARKKVQA